MSNAHLAGFFHVKPRVAGNSTFTNSDNELQFDFEACRRAARFCYEKEASSFFLLCLQEFS